MHWRWDSFKEHVSGHRALMCTYYQFLPAHLKSGLKSASKLKGPMFVLTTGFPVCTCVCPTRHRITCAVKFKQFSTTHLLQILQGANGWFGGGVRCPGPGEHSGRGSKCPAEWKMAACEESVCSQLRPWQETVRAVLLLLQLPPPVIDLHFHFANNASTALMMERPISLLCSSGGAKVCMGVFCNAARW